MIDGIHFEIPTEAVHNSDILEFKYQGNKYRANYNGLIIDRYTHTCKVSGSIHKYFNNGEHNYNDFSLSDYKKAICDLGKVLNINPEVIKINKIEAGVNIDLGDNLNAYDVLSSILMLNYKIPEKMGQIGYVFKFREYDIKIYAKSLKQYPDKLRIELVIRHKTKRSSIIKEYTPYCNTLEDLGNPEVWKAFGNELILIFDKIIIIDKENLDYNNLTTKETKLLLNGGNALYWKRDWSRQTRHNHLKQFIELIKSRSGTQVKDELKHRMVNKIDTLIKT